MAQDNGKGSFSAEIPQSLVDEAVEAIDKRAAGAPPAAPAAGQPEGASPSEVERLRAELELSQNLQRALLPQQTPPISGLDIAAYSRPAQIVTGDYFDFVQFKDGLPGIVIADISGHGVSAGMLMTSLQTAFHTLVPESTSPVEVLERINRLYVHNIRLTSFVTVFFGKFDPASHILSYASAGHPARGRHCGGDHHSGAIRRCSLP